jgi:2-polyprenyl-6-methoxyphenol hydroxylase-like FAD-dependent oxidoreductase
VIGIVFVENQYDINQALQAGQIWQRLHLAATVYGVAAQPMNQPMEMADRRFSLNLQDHFGPALAKLARVEYWYPTFAFRLGYAERDAVPSPRRPLAKVIVRA